MCVYIYIYIYKLWKQVCTGIPPHTLAFYSANLVVHVNVAMGYGYTNHLHRHCTDNIDV